MFCMSGLYLLHARIICFRLTIRRIWTYNLRQRQSDFKQIPLFGFLLEAITLTLCAPFRFLILAVLVILAEWIFVKPESVLLPLFSIAQI